MKYWLLILFPLFASGQQADELFARLTKKFKQVQHYQVVAQIKPNIPLIKILPVKAQVEFTYPNTFKIKSAGISILPKNGFSELPLLFSQPNQFTAIASGNEVIQGTRTEIITLLPRENEGDLVLAKIWVDTQSMVILKSVITSRSNGTIISEFDYTTEKAFGLPSRMKFTIDVKKFKIPKGVATDINRTNRQVDDGNSTKKGSIEVIFSKYRVNS
jgi:outer membrane lipoprotein-sorting protein